MLQKIFYLLGVLCWVGVWPDRTESFAEARDSRMVSPIDVSMKITADQVVSFVRRLAAPRGPNAVCEP